MAGNQYETIECLHGGTTLQNGRIQTLGTPPETRRLVGQGRPKRRIFFHPDQSGTQEIPVLCSREQHLPLQLPPIRPVFSPMGLSQDLKASSSSWTVAGDVIDSVHR